MAEEFDPYRLWLGIPPEEQPPNAYRLLGIGLFESDPGVIDEAADRQMAHVQRHKLGRYAALSQKLLNELSSAKLCLLKADRKALYDRQLRAKLAAQSRPTEVAPTEAPGPAAPAPTVRAAAPRRRPTPVPAVEAPSDDLASMSAALPSGFEARSRRSKPKPNRMPLLAAGGVALVVVIGGLLLMANKTPDEAKPAAVASAGGATAQPSGDEEKPTAARSKVKETASTAAPLAPEEEAVEADAPEAEAGETTAEPAGPAPMPPPASAQSPTEPQPAPPAVTPPAVTPPAVAPSTVTPPTGAPIVTPLVVPVAVSPEPAEQPAPAHFELAGHTAHITCIAVNPADPNQVVSASYENYPQTPLRAWDLAGRRPLPDLIRNADHDPTSICFTADGQFMAHAAQNGVHLQKLGTDFRGRCSNRTHSVSLVRGADQRLLLARVGDDGGGIWDCSNVYEANGEREIARFAEKGPAHLVVFAPDASRLYAGQGGAWTETGHEYVPGSNFKLRVMSMQTAQSEFLPGHTGTIWGIAVSRDGAKGVTASEDRTLRIWDLQALKSVRTLKGHEGPVYAVAMSPDGNFVLSGGADKTVRLWNAKTGQELQKFAGHTDIVRAVALTQDGKYALSGGNDKLLRAWDLQGLIPASNGSGARGPKVAGGAAPAAQKRAAVPDAAAIETAATLIREVFAEDFKLAKKPPEKTALAEKLLQQAGESQSDPERYALFTEARALAGGGGNPALALQIIEQLAGQFEVDVAQEAVAYLEPLLKKADALPGPARKELAEALLPLAEGALARADYDTARRLITLANTSARKTNDTALVRQIAGRLTEVNDAKKLFDAYQKAEAKLAANADDAEAQLAAGKYLCFVKQDWAAGLPHLARGSDAALREAAEAELKAPSALEEQVKLGDLWWALADQAKAKEKIDYAERCDKWYSTALPGLKGLGQTKVNKRLEELAKSRPAARRPAPGGAEDRGSGGGGEPLAAKFAPRIKKAIAANALQRDAPAGVGNAINFGDLPPAGLILAGIKITFDDPQHELTSVTPIYWTTRGTQNGATFGDPARGRSVEAMSKPGYAVVGFRLRTTNFQSVSTIQVLFAKLGPKGIDVDDQYWSERVGPYAVEHLRLNPKSNVCVGILGSTRDGVITDLGLVAAPEN